MTSRQFLQSASDSRNSVRELLQLIFAAELLAPSQALWIVSPWIRDVPILDNQTGSFLSLYPEFPRTEIRLSKILGLLVDRGTRVIIATRPDEGNRQVLDGIGGASRNNVRFLERANLHAKGIIGDSFCLLGSMNLTYNGLDNLTEMLVFQTAREQVEQLRLTFGSEYGGLT